MHLGLTPFTLFSQFSSSISYDYTYLLFPIHYICHKIWHHPLATKINLCVGCQHGQILHPLLGSHNTEEARTSSKNGKDHIVPNMELFEGQCRYQSRDFNKTTRISFPFLKFSREFLELGMKKWFYKFEISQDNKAFITQFSIVYFWVVDLKVTPLLQKF